MTRLAGRPATPAPTPKAPSRSSNQPKPRYVKIPAPKPAPVVNVRTGNNPRGTAIVTKAPPPKFLTGGNNPRGVAIKPNKPVYAPTPKPRLPKAKPSGGGFLGLGAITPSSVIHFAEHIPSDVVHVAKDVVHVPIIHNTLTDARDLVPNTLEGIAAIAQAGGNDLLHVAGGATHLGPGASVPEAHYHSQLEGIAKQSWHQSFLHDAVTGNWKGAIAKLKANPLYAAINLVGAADGAGEILGAVARTGAAGSRLAKAAELARGDKEILPNSPGVKRSGSSNLLVRAVQRKADETQLPPTLDRAVREHQIKKTVNEAVGITKQMADHHEQEIVAEQHRVAAGERSLIDRRGRGKHHIPAGRKVAADVASMQAMGAVDRVHAIDDLRSMHDSIAEHLQDRNVKGIERKTAETNLANIRKVLDHPDTKAIDEISRSFLERGAKQQREMQDLHLISAKQAETSPLHGAVAAGHIEGDDLHIADKANAKPSVRKAAYLTAKADLKIEESRFRTAELKAQKLPASERAEFLKPAKENLAEAKAEFSSVKAYKNDKVKGIIERTNERLPGRTPKYAYRHVPAAEVRARLVAAGRHPDEMGYFNLQAPVDKGEIAASRKLRTVARPDAAIRSRTASGVPKGNFRPGSAGLLDSALQTQRAIDKAKSFDYLDSLLGSRDTEGNLITESPKKIAAVKARIEAETGLKHTIIPRHSASSVNRVDKFMSSPSELKLRKNERYGLMPTAAVAHYIKHAEIDHSATVRHFGAINRAFRGTVLGLNPRWIAGNDIEGLLRSGLEGATPRDAQLVSKVKGVLAARGEHQANDIIDALRSGQQYGRAVRKQHEALVEGSLTHPDRPTLLRNRPVIKQLVDFYQHNITGPVFYANAKLEHGFDNMVLGQFMHDQMKQLGANMYQAAMHEQAYIEKLADGFANPQLAHEAGRYMQKTLGQYARFGPRAKFMVNTLFPFAPWYTSALRFIYVTMPKDHAITQSVLLAAQQTVASEFSKQAIAQGQLNPKTFGHRFGELQTDMPVSGGGLVDIGKMLPWGAASGGPVAMAASIAGPQFQGPALAMLAHEDAFGSPLKDKNGDVTDLGQATIIGLNELLLSLAGPVDLYDRTVRDQGKTPYSADTVFNQATKPGTDHGVPGVVGGLEKSLIPFYPTHLSSTPAAASGDGTTGVGVGGAAPIGRSGAAAVGRSGAAVVGR